MNIILTLVMPLISSLASNFIKGETSKNKVFVLGQILTFILVILTAFSNANIELLRVTEDLIIAFKVDSLAVVFSVLISFIFMLVSIYSTYYFKKDKYKNTFYLFYNLSLASILGIIYSANLMSFYTCFELMTFLTMMLIIHDRTSDAIRVTLKFLGYSVFGALLILVGFMILTVNNVDTSFVSAKIMTSNSQIITAYLLIVLGFSVKAGMFPLHSWLWDAHPIAPSPASALLSGVITKVGVLGIIRTTYYIYDIEILKGTTVQIILITLATITIFMGSMLAFKEQNLKKRLAYSTISQVSYALVAIFMYSSLGFVAAILQVIYHALAKDCLFMCAGNIIHKTHDKEVSAFNEVAYKLPITMICFTVASLSLVGIPLFGGFISKWYIAEAVLVNSFGIIIVTVLIVSAILTAHYLLSPIIKAYFTSKENVAQKENLISILPLILLSVLTVYLAVDTRFIEYISEIYSSI